MSGKGVPTTDDLPILTDGEDVGVEEGVVRGAE
jgi:hypothetical protein